jgi:L-lactate dehydrogenase complex protein LldG
VSARDAILARIRAATGDVPDSDPRRWEGPRSKAEAYARTHELSGEALVARFMERVADYRASVVRCADDDAAIGTALTEALAAHQARRPVIPHDLPSGWLPDGVAALIDQPAAPLVLSALDSADGVVTASALAIAETGTIALDCGPGQGRRALTLVPDLHLCVVKAADVVGTVPEAIERLEAAAADGRPITLVSGPSATSDIEMSRVEGVHGPRRLVVVVAG